MTENLNLAWLFFTALMIAGFVCGWLAGAAVL